MQFDFSLEELRAYRPERREPVDFDKFWADTLDEVRAYSLDAQYSEVDFGLQTVETYDVRFTGYGGQRVSGWLLLPKNRAGNLPCVVEYLGYSNGRGFPTDRLLWSSAGYAHLVMDTRGQGYNARGSHGNTPDSGGDEAHPAYPGFMTRGILSPETYYYRRVYSDAVRAIEAACSHTAVDPDQIILTGASQGGGITLAAGGLVPYVKVVMSDVPFLCHFRRATQITDAEPYREIVSYCKAHRDQVERVFATLAYFDGMNFTARCAAKGLFSVGLMDLICPPSTVFAAYNHFRGSKEIRIYEFNDHEGGGNFQAVEQVKYLRQIFNR